MSPSLGKFHRSFNNILNIIGHNRDEILAVRLTKTYCLPTVIYGCEAWAGCAIQLLRLSPCQSHRITHSGKFLTRAGEKVPDHFSFIVAVSLLVILLTSVVCCFTENSCLAVPT